MTGVESRQVVVVGGGPAGLMAAATASARGHRVTLVEKNAILGKKLLITGKGRCNVTTSCDREDFFKQIARNPKFLHSAFAAFDNLRTIQFFEDLGVPLKEERGKRMFPESDRSADVRDALVRHARSAGVRFTTGEAASLLTDEDTVTGLRMQQGGTLPADAVIVATGGLSYPATGSTGDGYRFAKAAGHSVAAPTASLVPLVCAEPWAAELQGLSLRNVKLKLADAAGKKLYSEQGELLFTHFGISGPLTLSASTRLNGNSPYTAVIDLKPALDHPELDARLLRDFAEYQNRDFANALDKLLPKLLIPVMVRLSGILPHKKVHSLTREERTRLRILFKELPLTVTGTRPIEEAIITRGGVSVKELLPGKLESRLVKGLFFAGEVLDLDGLTGGFNLQIAFSTGFLAGSKV